MYAWAGAVPAWFCIGSPCPVVPGVCFGTAGGARGSVKRGLLTLDTSLADAGTGGIPEVGKVVGVNSMVESVLGVFTVGSRGSRLPPVA